MSEEEIDLNEYICFKEKCSEEDKFFNREKTLKLLDLYKKYKPKLGTFEVKSMKKLWELVARDLSNEFRITVPPNKCENRFKVLERNYKKVVDNNNKTGRGRKVFEYEKEMDELFEAKRNITPVLLLSSNTIRKGNENPVEISVSEMEPIPSCSYIITETESIERSTQNSVSGAIEQSNVSTKKSLSRKRKRACSPAYKKRNDILMEIKNDLKSYYERKDKREEEKLELAKRKQADREKKTQITQEYLDFLKENTRENNNT